MSSQRKRRKRKARERKARDRKALSAQRCVEAWREGAEAGFRNVLESRQPLPRGLGG